MLCLPHIIIISYTIACLRIEISYAIKLLLLWPWACASHGKNKHFSNKTRSVLISRSILQDAGDTWPTRLSPSPGQQYFELSHSSCNVNSLYVSSYDVITFTLMSYCTFDVRSKTTFGRFHYRKCSIRS